MASTQIRYFVRFTVNAGIYQGGDEVALDAAEYERESKRKGGPLFELLYESHEELDVNRVVVNAKKVVPPPRARVAPDGAGAARIAELEQQLKDLREKAALGSDPEKARLVEEHAKMTERIKDLESKGADFVKELEAEVARLKQTYDEQIAELKARLAAHEKPADEPGPEKNREGAPKNKRG